MVSEDEDNVTPVLWDRRSVQLVRMDSCISASARCLISPSKRRIIWKMIKDWREERCSDTAHEVSGVRI